MEAIDEKYEDVPNSYISTVVNRNKQTAITVHGEEGPFSTGTGYTLFQNLLIHSVNGFGCGGKSSELHFFDATSGQSVADLDSYLPNYPKEFSYGNLKFEFVDWKDVPAVEEQAHSIKYGNDDTPSLGALEPVSLWSDFSQHLKAELDESVRFGTYTYYGIQFTEIPEITFYYKASMPQAFGLIHANIPAQKIAQNGDLLDEEVTKKILKHQSYSDERSDMDQEFFLKLGKNTEDSYDAIELKDFSPNMMPIYRVKNIKDDLYALYTTEKYKAFTTAELCKPLVYVYDVKNRNNTLRIDFPKGGFFTKIIPDFTSVNTWNFSADAFSHLSVNHQKIADQYLYYSAVVPNYTFNHEGWQIRGRDVEKFFQEKLDYISFNEQEKRDFIDYWKTEFEAEKLYFISFKFDEQIDEYVTLNFAEKPKKQMRVLLEAHTLDEKQYNPAFVYPNVGKNFDQKILKKFVRSGEFDVFEWGGIVQDMTSGKINIR